MSSVDIVVPCYCYGHFLRQCVQSVLTQTGVEVRILIIDDSSPDNAAEVATDLAAGDCRVTFVRHSINRGHISTYNEGIEWASADYMLLLSADDYLLPGALKRAADLMNVHPEVGFTFGSGFELQEDETLPANVVPVSERPGWRIISGLEFIELSGCRNVVSTPTGVVRTNLQKRLGGYRPELPHSGDMEMWLRFAAHGSVGILESYQAVYRRHAANMSLTYSIQSGLPDLQQRKAAVDSFFYTCSSVLEDPQRLRRKILQPLASRAVAIASSAFNEGEIQLSDMLSDFALHTFPAVKRSWSWTKLRWKRRLGHKKWRTLEPIAAAIRRKP